MSSQVYELALARRESAFSRVLLFFVGRMAFAIFEGHCKVRRVYIESMDVSSKSSLPGGLVTSLLLASLFGVEFGSTVGAILVTLQ